MNKLSVNQQLAVICLVAMIGLVTLGTVSKLQINQVFDSSKGAVLKTTPTYLQFFEINKNLNNVIQRSLVHMIATDDDSKIELQLEIDDAKEKLQASIDKLSKDACGGGSCIHNEDEQRKFAFIKSELANYEQVREHAFELAQSGKREEAEQVLKNDVLPALDSLQDAIQSELDFNQRLAQEGMAKAGKEKAESVKFTLVVAFISLIALLFISFFVFKALQRQLGLEPRKLADLAKQFSNGNLATVITLKKNDQSSVAYSIKSLQDTLNQIVESLNYVSERHDNGDLDESIDDQRFKGSYGEMVKGINRMVQTHVNSSKKVVTVVEAFGHGNFDAPLARFPGKQAYINNTIEKVRTNIKDFITDMNSMSIAHDAGDIDLFMDEDKYDGAYKEMASGLNKMVKNHLEVSKKAMIVVQAFGEGDFDVPMEDLPGKKAEIKLTIENVRHNIKTFIADMHEISQQHDLGNIDSRIDTNKFNGAYKEMAEGVNNMLIGYIELVDQAIDVVSAFGEGDFNKPLQIFPGKKEFINKAIEQVRSNLAALSEDTMILSNAARKGEIEIRAGVERHHGEFAKIIEGINETLDLIVDPILTAKDAVNTINNAAQEISNGNNDLSKRTEIQASNLEETTASMEELSSTVNQNSENTKKANQLANDATSIALKGGDAVNEVIKTMSSLNESAYKIEQITSVINSIAFQTNILALNAAVEAARAGEHGSGFAVVANEVRNLAQRSANAAKEIKQLIDESVGKTAQGATEVAAAGKRMEEIVTAVQKVKSIVEDIAVSTSEQRTGINQINEAVNHMDHATQQNSALVEEVAAAAESLADQSNHLARAFSFFKLRANPIALPTHSTPKYLLRLASSAG
ncbi:MAG: methyl-accepting chemotaxis protein [Methylophilaceae bacterium]|nr:methyl-accepting chemotaxis protein [Methyloradius sp.]